MNTLNYHQYFMVYRNFYSKSILLIVCSIVLSCCIHILLIIFMVYQLSFEINKPSQVVPKCKIITLSSISNNRELNIMCLSENGVEKVLENTGVEQFKLLKSREPAVSDFKNKVDLNSNFVEFDKNHINPEQDNCIILKPETAINADVNTTASKPRLIRCIYPTYPNQAKALGIEGNLIVMYDIDCIGKIKNIRVLSSTSPGIFEHNVKSAMKHWVFEPYNSRQNLIITFKFSLNNVKICNQ